MILPAVEERFDYKGFPCVVIMQPMCFRTAYIGLPKGNRYFGKDYSSIPVGCHGGLTYSSDHLYGQTDKDTWWIGFDTGHYGDGYAFEDAKQLFAGNEVVLEHIALLEREEFCSEWEAMTLAYCKNECRRIVDQIIEFQEEK